MICKQCGASFSPRTVVQKFCSKKCCWRYHKTHDMWRERQSITFTCAKCGKVVVTETDGARPDKRSDFVAYNANVDTGGIRRMRMTRRGRTSIASRNTRVGSAGRIRKAFKTIDFALVIWKTHL